jgi:hypothetical protein
MARPPIIISNGGIVDILAAGCNNKSTDQDVAAQIMQNIRNLNSKDGATVAMIVKNKNGQGTTPCLYWRLPGDPPFSQGPNGEGASINDVVDET